MATDPKTAAAAPLDAAVPAGEPTWSILTAFVFLFLWLALMLVITQSSLILAAALSSPNLVSSEAFVPYAMGFATRALSSDWASFGLASSIALTWSITFGLIELFLRAPRAALDAAFGVRLPVPRWSAATGAILGVAIFAFAVGVEQLLPVDTEPGPFDASLRTIPGIAGLLLTALLIAPLAEEFFFRGFVLPPLLRKLPVSSAILVNGLLFASVHVVTYSKIDAAELYPIFALGAAAAALRVWSGSLLPGVVAHVVFNATSIAAFLLTNTRS